MSNFSKYAILSLLLFISCSYAADADTEICKDVETVDTNQYDILSTTFPVTQPECVKYFKLDLSNPAYTGKSIRVDLRFETPIDNLNSRVIFLKNSNSIPFLYFSGTGVNAFAQMYDNEAYVERKAYHSMFINKEEVSLRGIAYFAIYKRYYGSYVSEEVKYTINVEASNHVYICKNNCSHSLNQGDCDLSLKRCVCRMGYFDSECGTKAEMLTASNITKIINPSTWDYFAVSLSGVDADAIRTIFEFTQIGNATFSFQTNRQWDYSLPPSLANVCNNCNISSEDLAYQPVVSIHFSRLKNAPNGNILVRIFNRDIHPVEVVGFAVYFKEPGLPNIFTLFLIIAVSGVVMIAGCTIMIRYKGRRRQRQNQGIFIVEMQGHGQGQVIPEQQQNQFLTKEELQKYFPKKKYSELQSSFVQTSCSVCLEEYAGDTICRQLYCEHIFHELCILEWLAKHESCPNCKSEITKKAIKKFFKKKKQVNKGEIKDRVQKIENNTIASYSEGIVVRRSERESPVEVRNRMENSMYESSQQIELDHQPQEAAQNQGNNNDEESERLHEFSAEE